MKNPFGVFFKNKVCRPLINVQGRHAAQYPRFKAFLGHNHTALDSMALLEQVYHGSEPFTQTAVQCRYEELIEAAFGVVYSLEQLAGRDYPVLRILLFKRHHDGTAS